MTPLPLRKSLREHSYENVNYSGYKNLQKPAINFKPGNYKEIIIAIMKGLARHTQPLEGCLYHIVMM